MKDRTAVLVAYFLVVRSP